MSLALKALRVSLPKLFLLALAVPVYGDGTDWCSDLFTDCVYHVCERSAETKCVVMGDKFCSDKLFLGPVMRVRLELNKEACQAMKYIKFVPYLVMSGDLVCAEKTSRDIYDDCKKVHCVFDYLLDGKADSAQCKFKADAKGLGSKAGFIFLCLPSEDESSKPMPSEVLVSIGLKVPGDAFMSKGDPQAIVQDVSIDMTNTPKLPEVWITASDDRLCEKECRPASSPFERYCDMEWEWCEHTGE